MTCHFSYTYIHICMYVISISFDAQCTCDPSCLVMMISDCNADICVLVTVVKAAVAIFFALTVR